MQRISKSTSIDEATAKARAKAWFEAQLKLISEDPDAAHAAFEEMERYNESLRTAWELKTGLPVSGGSSGVDQVTDDFMSNASPGLAVKSSAHNLTRNQISKVRAVYLMEALARDGSNHPLSELHAELRAHGFQDEHGNELTEAALRSHLFRLKDAGYVAVVSTGVYELTNDGFDHLKRERVAQKALLERFGGSGR